MFVSSLIERFDMSNSFKLIPAAPYPLGLSEQNGIYHVSYIFENAKECGLILYIDEVEHKIPFDKNCKMGNLYSAIIDGDLPDTFSYHLFKDDAILDDPYMKNQDNNSDSAIKKAFVKTTKEDWDLYWNPCNHYSYAERIIYMLHVKGFTQHKNSQVKLANRGTYDGIIQKIMYMKSFGTTTVLLMPIYSFDDNLNKKNEAIIKSKELDMNDAVKTYTIDFDVKGNGIAPKKNYWGYSDGNYYLPNQNYAATKDSVVEFKNLIKTIHGSKMEVFLQFYFDEKKSVREILDILIYWKQEYHIDGFELIGPDIPLKQIVNEPALCDTPILSDRNDISADDMNQQVGYMNHDWMRQFRCFLKGDNHSGYNAAMAIKNGGFTDTSYANIHYIAKQNTMRLADLVSYHDKYNEDNGENNRDGETENYSWNCGIEGFTKKRNIVALRNKQMLNALCFVYLSQGTPLIYSGDEFGNTQFGNNNPYCQDNDISYLKWSTSKTAKRMIEFTIELSQIRKKYPIITGKIPYKGTDYLSVGYPDISIHGEEAWKNDLLIGSYHFGVLYNNYYADESDDTLVYVGYNMHWEPHDLALPKLTDHKKWEMILATDDTAKVDDTKVHVPERSVVVLKSVK